MQVLKEETEQFKLWYQEQTSTQNPNKIPKFMDVNPNFVNAYPIEDNSTQPGIEATTKNKSMNSSQLAMITASMINKTQETITKFEQTNDDQIAKITRSMIDKTQECLAKYEEIGDIRFNLDLKHQNKSIKRKCESIIEEVETIKSIIENAETI